MSMRLLFVGFTLPTAVAILGCIVILRSRYTVPGLVWVISSLVSTLLGLLLITGRSFIPDFLSIVVANELMLATYVLMHQAIAAILGSSRRGIVPSAVILGGHCLALIHYTYISDSIGARTVAISVAIILQVSITIEVLLRHNDAGLLYPVHVLRWLFAAFLLLHFSRMVLTLLWPPNPDLMHPDLLQTCFMFLNFVMLLADYLALMWLAFWAQRDALQILALTDTLSGLMNRRAFDEILEHELKRANRKSQRLALLLIDIDSFKTVNDTYGHQAGDEVIRQVAQVLLLNVRGVDRVARYGGEEFAMLLCDVPVERAEQVAERLRREIAAIPELPEGIQVTVSIGIAVYGPDDTTASLVKRSDDALYLSKRLGRNRVSVETV
jgi:diguanylate cyclase (GGDEF)-like protein